MSGRILTSVGPPLLEHHLLFRAGSHPIASMSIVRSALIVKENLELVQQILEAKLKEAAGSWAVRDSIRIHQVADPVDMTQQASEREMAVNNLDRDSALARQLRSAIERIHDGSYGVCLQCEENIAPKRLKAIPWAALCINCQERADGTGVEREIALTFSDRTEAA